MYEEIGYRDQCFSSDNEGLEELKVILKDKTSLVAGQSGVGKSTLINKIQPDLA
jgi:ribosome biogenesis GTPase